MFFFVFVFLIFAIVIFNEKVYEIIYAWHEITDKRKIMWKLAYFGASHFLYSLCACELLLCVPHDDLYDESETKNKNLNQKLRNQTM